MVKKLVLSGCSFAWGEELSSRDDRYGQLIANYYNCNLFDVSTRGNCNSLISDYAVEQILKLLTNTDSSDILALISWSFPDRLAIWNKDKKWFSIVTRRLFKNNDKLSTILRGGYQGDVSTFKLIYDIVDDLQYLRYKFIKEIIYLQNFLKHNKIKYVFTFPTNSVFNLISPIEFLNRDDGYRMVDVDILLRELDKTPLVSTNMYHITDKYFLPKGPGNHPLAKAHDLFSKSIIEHIETNKLFD